MNNKCIPNVCKSWRHTAEEVLRHKFLFAKDNVRTLYWGVRNALRATKNGSHRDTFKRKVCWWHKQSNSLRYRFDAKTVRHFHLEDQVSCIGALRNCRCSRFLFYSYHKMHSQNAVKVDSSVQSDSWSTCCVKIFEAQMVANAVKNWLPFMEVESLCSFSVA